MVLVKVKRNRPSRHDPAAVSVTHAVSKQADNSSSRAVRMSPEYDSSPKLHGKFMGQRRFRHGSYEPPRQTTSQSIFVMNKRSPRHVSHTNVKQSQSQITCVVSPRKSALRWSAGRFSFLNPFLWRCNSERTHVGRGREQTREHGKIWSRQKTIFGVLGVIIAHR